MCLAGLGAGDAGRSRYRCGRGECSPDADVAAVSPVPVQMWAGVSPVPVQIWQGGAQSRCRCGSGEPSHGADSDDGIPCRMGYHAAQDTMPHGTARDIRSHEMRVATRRIPHRTSTADPPDEPAGRMTSVEESIAALIEP